MNRGHAILAIFEYVYFGRIPVSDATYKALKTSAVLIRLESVCLAFYLRIAVLTDSGESDI